MNYSESMKRWLGQMTGVPAEEVERLIDEEADAPQELDDEDHSA